MQPMDIAPEEIRYGTCSSCRYRPKPFMLALLGLVSLVQIRTKDGLRCAEPIESPRFRYQQSAEAMSPEDPKARTACLGLE